MGLSNKQFWDRRSRKLHRKKVRRRKRVYNSSRDNKNYNRNDESYVPDYIINLPNSFSFLANLEETVGCFNQMSRNINKAKYRAEFLIDARTVEAVSIDAIMYLIAIMRNYKIVRNRLFSFKGTYPQNSIARNVFVESGFLKFVKSKTKQLPANNEKVTIVCGKKNDSSVAGKICGFVADKLNVSRIYVQDLYNAIIEMMSNVYYHAYDIDDEVMIPEWYVYAEYKNREVKIVFLDTGLGIGKTVRKHTMYEKVVNKIGIGKESLLIKSALEGEFRTQTGEDNHGKGLPCIRDFAATEKVKDFHIISGKGHCWMSKMTKEIQTEEIENRINGTVYCFSIVNLEE